MRSQKVKINGKTIEIKESKVKELRNDVIPKFTSMFDEKKEDIQINDMIQIVIQNAADIINGLEPEDIEEAYPSEVEALVEAWVDVNFTGIKKIINLSQSSMEKYMRK